MKSRMRIDRRTVLGGLAASVAVGPSVALAEAWKPTRTVRIVVGYAAGGISDIMARLVADHLQERWGEAVIVENRTGGAGVVGTMEMINSPADGHTLLLGNTGPQAVAYPLFSDLPYTRDQVAAISTIIKGSNLLVANNDVPADTVSEFVEWLKEEDGAVPYASSGSGSTTHLSALWFLGLTGAEAIHVPYQGSAPAVADVMSGTVAFYFDNLANGIEFVRSGQMKALGVTSAERSPHAPDIPAIAETMPELERFDVATFYGLFTRSGTPDAAIQEINAGVRDFLELESTKEHLETWAAVPAWASPEETERYIDGEVEKWGSVIESEGLTRELN